MFDDNSTYLILLGVLLFFFFIFCFMDKRENFSESGSGWNRMNFTQRGLVNKYIQDGEPLYKNDNSDVGSECFDNCVDDEDCMYVQLQGKTCKTYPQDVNIVDGTGKNITLLKKLGDAEINDLTNNMCNE